MGFWKGVAAAVLTIGCTAPVWAQSWTVKPEWVRAHEEFLASDVLLGRGSATRDEEIAATYVASEFEGYGLTFAPGMTGYLQSAEIADPLLNGHGILRIGGKSLAEGTDFDLLESSGEPAQGPLQVVAYTEFRKAKIEHGAVVMVTGVPVDLGAIFGMLRAIHRGQASALVVVPGGDASGLMTMLGGKTRTPIRLAESEPSWAPTVVVLHKEQAAESGTASAGTEVSLQVTKLPVTAPRHTYNAIGYLQGADPKAGTILLTAHLDHLGVGRPVNGDAIFNGANDDAAGTTAVLELAHALASGPKLRRSVLFVCYGSEEAGELGSTYFGAHPPVPLKDLVANLEFEMIGNQDPKMPKGVLLLTGYERSNLGPMLKEHGALIGPDPYPEQHFFERSDNYALALKGVVAHTAAGWGTVPTYHQPNDDLAHLDMPFMTEAIQSLVEPVRWLASSDFVPRWNSGGRPRKD